MRNELVCSLHGRTPFPRSVVGLRVPAIGAILLIAPGVQILTGIVLAIFYVPTAEPAFDSITHITRAARHGGLLRNMYAIGASLFFFARCLHIFRGMYYNVYRKPWTTMWMVSVTLYIPLMMTASLGYGLIWGQKGYWTATAITRSAQTIPWVGDTPYVYLVGSHTPGTSMLGRSFVIYFISPLVIVVTTVIYIRTVQPAFVQAMKKKFSEKKFRSLLFDYKIIDFDAIKITLFLMVFAWFLFFAPHYLSSIDNFITADSTIILATVAPEWYSLLFFSILRCFPNELAGLTAMYGSILIFYFLLWFDTSRARFRYYSRPAKHGFWLRVINACFLSWLGSKALVGLDLFDDFRNEEDRIRAAPQLSTLVWFG